MSETANSETLPASSSSEPPVDFLEKPLDELFDRKVSDMSPAEVENMLAAIAELRAPGGLVRELSIEAGSVAIGKPKPKRASKKPTLNINDLL